MFICMFLLKLGTILISTLQDLMHLMLDQLLEAQLMHLTKIGFIFQLDITEDLRQ
jgi:hypothetical protein